LYSFFTLIVVVLSIAHKIFNLFKNLWLLKCAS